MSHPNSSGYTLDQLLEWCKDDRLIDGYDRTQNGIVIFHMGSRHELSPADAHTFLKGIFTATHRGEPPGDPNLA